MPPELLSFVVVTFGLGGWAVLALLLRRIVRLDMQAAERRLVAQRRRDRRALQRAALRHPEPRRVIGFLAHLTMRDSEPPTSALAPVRRALEAYVHHPAPTLDTRGVVRPRCRTR